MILKVLGCYGPYPAAGQACSGYLLSEGGTSVLLDCGNGVLSRLRFHLQPWELKAVIASHLHGDHVGDLSVLRYALQIKHMQEGGEALKIYAPGEPHGEFERLAYKQHMQPVAVYPGQEVEIGPFKFSFTAGIHAFPSHIVTVKSGKKKLVYSGDTEYFPGLAGAAEGADLFLCEANYLQKDIDAGHPNHLAAFQAALAARDAGVKRLVLTHHHPERELSEGLSEAQEIFPAEMAVSGSIYQI